MIQLKRSMTSEQFHQRLCGGEMNQLKRSMTLDLNRGVVCAKRPRYNAAVTAAPVLSSPDLNMLKLASPELEKFIMAQQGTATPTPTNQLLFPRQPTLEQENYARGFEVALSELQHSDSSQGGYQQVELPRSSSSSSSSGATYMTLDGQFPPVSSSSFGFGLSPYSDGSVLVKDEPQTVPSLGNSPPLSPINMECQERIKLERKRQRNRVAASKCRRRKLERIARLEDKVKCLKGENTELSGVVIKLKEEVCRLKEQVMDHVQDGCQIMASPHF